MEFFKKKVLPYLITFVIGLVMFVLVIASKHIFSQSDKKEIFRILSDAFTVPAVVLGGIGLLIFLSNEGAFDIISYGMIMFIGKFKRNVNDRKYQTYYDYKVAKRGNKKSFGSTLIIGILYLIFAILFLILYNNLE